MKPRELVGITVVLALALVVLLPDAFGQSSPPTPFHKRLLSGFVSYELDLHQAQPQGEADLYAALAGILNFFPPPGLDMVSLPNYFPAPNDQCRQGIGPNVKVNQNCLNLSDTDLQGRGQANNETTIAQDANHPNHLVAGDNDYRRGDGSCGAAYSLDDGRHWQDTALPINFTRGVNFGGVAREYWQASGDPSVAWDTQGNAYFACMAFQRGEPISNNPDQSSAVYVFRSTLNNGASWNFPGHAAVETFTTSASGLPLNDKPYMAVDNHVGSPFQDRIFVTWTLFAADGTAIIYESHSNDYGQTFSSPVLVSQTSSLCPNSFGIPTTITTCNENQFSQPFIGSDGALYVVFDNFNNSASSATDNHNQILLAKSTDGGASFSAPVLVANYNDLPDCDTYQGSGQDPFRACVPEKGTSANSVFRAMNYAVGAVDPTNPSNVAVTFGSYINADSNPSNGCVPAGFASDGNNTYTGVKTPGACNNKILLSLSTNGGTSFNGTITDPTTLTIVSQAPAQQSTDQFWQWAAFSPSGALAVSYFDRQYGNDETTGFSDVSISSSRLGGRVTTARVTSSSMPPPTEFPNSFGNSVFYGDYSGLSAVGNAHPIWMDTRNPDLAVCPGTGVLGVPPMVCSFTEASGLQANDQEIFTASMAVK
jgi:hypothetical protein